MEVGRDDIVDSVVRLINGVGRSPYLFVGSGFSRRIYGDRRLGRLVKAPLLPSF